MSSRDQHRREFKQHFFEWAARVPLIANWPEQWKPARVAQNISLIDLMPTFVDVAYNSSFDDYTDNIDGQSLVGALEGNPATINDVAISEFAADGSTGPSRMVKRGNWKYMALEGVDTVLYNLDEDPNELNNLSGNSAYTEIEKELHDLAFDDWDMEYWREVISHSQKQRLKIHQITGGDPTYVHKIRDDDGERYIRNAGAADTKARARLPLVPAAQPDSKSR